MAVAGVGHRPARLSRDGNLAAVLATLRTSGPASRSELASRLELDRSTLTHLANSLISAGFVVESSEQPAGNRGGRRPRPLALNPRRYATIGVDVDIDHSDWSVARLDGMIVSRGRVARMDQAEAAQSSLAWVKEAPRAAARAARLQFVSPTEIIGAGLSVPGLVDHSAGVVTESKALGIRDVRFSAFDGIPACVADNDANCRLWNLVDDRDGLGSSVLCQLRLHRGDGGGFTASGPGIGLAISVDGEIYYGAHGSAGEIRGARWRTDCKDQFGLRLDVLEREHGREPAFEVFCSELLASLSIAVSVLDPARLFLTGDTQPVRAVLERMLQGDFATSAIGLAYSDGRVRFTPVSEYSAADGAARMMLSRLLDVPVGAHPGAEPGWHVITQRCS